jgi:hypothetical protein
MRLMTKERNAGSQSVAFSPCFCFTVRNQVSYPYKSSSPRQSLSLSCQGIRFIFLLRIIAPFPQMLKRKNKLYILISSECKTNIMKRIVPKFNFLLIYPWKWFSFVVVPNYFNVSTFSKGFQIISMICLKMNQVAYKSWSDSELLMFMLRISERSVCWALLKSSIMQGAVVVETQIYSKLLALGSASQNFPIYFTTKINNYRSQNSNICPFIWIN